MSNRDPIRPWMYCGAAAVYLGMAVLWEFRWPTDVFFPVIYSFGAGMLLMLGVFIDTLERQ